MNDHAKDTDRFLTLSEAAKLLGLEEDRLERDAQAGFLPTVWHDGRLVTKQEWLHDYIQRGREEHSVGDKQIRERLTQFLRAELESRPDLMNQETEVRDEHGGVRLDRAVTGIARLNSEQAREASTALPDPRPRPREGGAVLQRTS